MLDPYADDLDKEYRFENRDRLDSWVESRIAASLERREEILAAAARPNKKTAAESYRRFSSAIHNCGWSYSHAVVRVYQSYFDLREGDAIPQRSLLGRDDLSAMVAVEKLFCEISEKWTPEERTPQKAREWIEKLANSAKNACRTQKV